MDRDERPTEHPANDAAALDAFARRTEVPLLVLALLMVPLLIAPVALDLSERTERLFLTLDWFIWVAFALDLSIKTYLAPRKQRYLADNWIEVVIVVVPFLRPFRVLRSARALRALRLVRLVAFIAHFAFGLRAVLSRHRLDYALLMTLAVVVLSAALVARLESQAGGAIDGFGTALWWAFVTVTTVGYGDYTPESAPGRAIAVMLMVLGVGLFSLVAANVAAFFVTAEDSASDAELRSEIRELRSEISGLRSLIENSPASVPEHRTGEGR